MNRPGWDPARVASYGLAVCVHAFYLALIGVGIWLIVGISSIPSVVLGLFALLLAVEVRPRPGSFRKLKNVRRREDAPVLFALLDQVAAEAGSKPVHAVIADADWNASYRAVGWRRRRVVTLGLPLWDGLPADQKVAILGHEFGHSVNGDARHGTIIGTSITTLTRLYAMLLPGGRRHGTKNLPVALAEILMPLILLVPRSAIAGVLLIQQLISLRASQRAEYLADAIAARLASPASTADAIDTLVTGSSAYSWVLGRRRFSDPKTVIWDQFRSAQAEFPESEKERRRRECAHERLQMTDTHPPAHLRIKVLRGLPASEPRVILSTAQEAEIRAELTRDYTRIATKIDDAVGLVANW